MRTALWVIAVAESSRDQRWAALGKGRLCRCLRRTADMAPVPSGAPDRPGGCAPSLVAQHPFLGCSGDDHPDRRLCFLGLNWL